MSGQWWRQVYSSSTNDEQLGLCVGKEEGIGQGQMVQADAGRRFFFSFLDSVKISSILAATIVACYLVVAIL